MVDPLSGLLLNISFLRCPHFGHVLIEKLIIYISFHIHIKYIAYDTEETNFIKVGKIFAKCLTIIYIIYVRVKEQEQ